MLHFQEKRNNSNTNDNDNDNDNGSGNEMLIMGSQKNSYDSYGSGRVSIANNIGAFYSFSGTYFFSISGEKLNKPSDVQVVLLPHHPPLRFFAQTIKH